MAAVEFRYRNAKYQPHTFEWKIKCFYEYDEYRQRKFPPKFSPFFTFCGYFCQLHCNPKLMSNGYYFDIDLKGYAAPFKKNVSCYFSLSLVNFKGHEDFRKEGRIHSSDKTIHAVIAEDINWGNLTERERGFTFCFSWCEDGGSDASKQGMPTNGIECATQTEDVQILEAGENRYNAMSSVNIESATQTESTKPSTTPDIFCSNERGSNKLLEILSRDLSSFYENKTDPDCVLKVDETKFSVHRSVLSSRSTVFAAMFHHDTSESQSGEVNILDVDAGALGDVLYYIYAGKVRGLSPETAVSMYVVADKYALIDLREECLNFLTNNLTMENVCDAALLAHTHAETDLENNVLQFIEERLEELVQNDNWKKFSDTNLKLANYLLCSALVATKNKLMKLSSNA